MKSRSANISEVPRQNKWGGMIGVGGDRTNASISFSQRGDTTVNGSAQTYIEGVQLTASSTTNGSTTVGAAFNPSNEGPRRGQNYSINYDTDRGQLSGTAGYTDPNSGVGFTTNVDANGVSVSTQYNGINVATVSNNGFQYDEFNWAEQNINLAQDMTGDAERAQKARKELVRRGGDPELVGNLSDDDATAIEDNLRISDENKRLSEGGRSEAEIARMSQDERYEALNRLDNAPSPDATAGAAAGTTGLALVGALMLGRGRREDGFESAEPDALLAENRSRELNSQDPRLPKAIRENTGDYYDPRMDPDYQPRETAQSRGTVDMSRVWSTSDLKNKYTGALVKSVADNIGRLDRTNLTPIAGSEPIKREVKIVGDALGLNPMKLKDIAKLQESIGNSKRDVVMESANRIKQGIGTNKDRTISGFETRKSEINREISRLIESDRQLSLLTGREHSNPELSKRIAELTKLEKDFNKAISADLSRKLSENPALIKLVPNQAFDDAVKARNVQDARMVALSEDIQRLGRDAYKKELDKLIADPAYKKAQNDFIKAQKEYEAQLNGLLKNVDVTKPNPFTPDVLSRISKDYVEMTKVARLEIKEFNLYRDANGDQVLMTSANPQDNRQFLRSVQERQFLDNAEKLNQANKIKINPSSGIITHGVDGSPLEPNDNAGRKAAFDKVKAQIPDFNPAINPSHAKMEAVNNFRESIDPNTQLPMNRFETTVNGVLITTMNRAGDLGLDAVRLSNGSSWMDLARTAKEVGANEISINSIIKDGTHGKGYAMDVGSIKFSGSKVAEPISYSRENGNHLEKPSAKMKEFLSKIRDLPSTTFYATPWELRMGGAIYNNMFQAVKPESLWSRDGGNIGNDLDRLSPELREEEISIYQQIGAAANLDPNIRAQRDIITQMWNHRHHLHVSEVGGSQHAD